MDYCSGFKTGIIWMAKSQLLFLEIRDLMLIGIKYREIMNRMPETYSGFSLIYEQTQLIHLCIPRAGHTDVY